MIINDISTTFKTNADGARTHYLLVNVGNTAGMSESRIGHCAAAAAEDEGYHVHGIERVTEYEDWSTGEDWAEVLLDFD